MMLASTNVSGDLAVTVVGVILTICGAMILAFIAFFLRRLVQQLDRNSDQLGHVAVILSQLEGRVTSLESKTTVIPVKTIIPKSSVTDDQPAQIE